jgi:pyrimidine deaminase RibD-like protein
MSSNPRNAEYSENRDFEMMQRAIGLAKSCEPVGDHIPKVGAVIAVNGIVLATGKRGSGRTDDDDHAERNALKKVDEETQLPKATLYTTLEPCTPDVRSDPLNCCTEHILRSQIKRVFIGILDPNQGVRGKGLWELQTHGISVELFPPDLAVQIRSLNEEFIKLQQTPGIKITDPTQGQHLQTFRSSGVYEATGTFENEPGQDIYAFIQSGGEWWPQSSSLNVLADKKWKVKYHFGSYGLQTLHIVSATEIGQSLISYYRKVVNRNIERDAKLREVLGNSEDTKKLIKELPGTHPGIQLGGTLPKGLQSLAMVEVEIERPN